MPQPDGTDGRRDREGEIEGRGAEEEEVSSPADGSVRPATNPSYPTPHRVGNGMEIDGNLVTILIR